METKRAGTSISTAQVKLGMNFEHVEHLVRSLLRAIGEDPDREGLKETPARVARWWQEFIEYNPGNYDTTFESVSTDQMVVVTGMRVYSLCEHHLLPFWCDVSIGYITGSRVLGLSKFARIAHRAAHKLQIQERLVNEIADMVQQMTGTENVAVYGSGEHMCMTMRGVRTPALMKTSITRGLFREDPRTRDEFLSLIRG